MSDKKIADLTHDTSLDGTEKVPLSPDGYATVREIAASGLTSFTNDDITSVTPVPVLADGNTVHASVLVSNPPEWMDDAGNIILPGLFAVYCDFATAASPTNPATEWYIRGPFSGKWSGYWLSGILGSTFCSGDVQSLTDADLPYSTDFAFTSLIDATAMGQIKPLAVRLLVG